VRILVLDRSTGVGGRLRTIELGGCRVEAGAGVVHSSHRYLRRFVERFGLHTRPEGSGARASSSEPLFGVWNGTSFDVVGHGSTVAVMARLLARYPVSLVETVALARTMVRNLRQLYHLQKAGAAFDTPDDLLRPVHLQDLPQQVGHDYLQAHCVSRRFVDQIVSPVSRNSYCQDAGINALATLTCVIGTGLAAGSIFSVREGNQRLCSELLRLSRAEVRTGTAVSAIGPTGQHDAGDPHYRVVTGQGYSLATHAVLLCAPLADANIRLVGWDPLVKLASTPYQITNVTFAAARLNRSYFKGRKLLPANILTEEIHNLPFFAIARVGMTSNGVPVYRTFSRYQLSDQVLDTLFTDRDETRAVTWSAYPVLTPTRQQVPFRVSAGLYYANAMEQTVSTLETQTIASRNLVNLLEKDVRELMR
jgi:prenylcysteine oxidase / farnesylcysteine lyase